MNIVVDYSVAKGVLYGHKASHECLTAIEKRTSFHLLVCAEWTSHWKEVLENLSNKNSIHLSFLCNWKTHMQSKNRMRRVRDEERFNSETISELQHLCKSEDDKDYLYLVELAHCGDKVVVFCDTLSATCSRFSEISHHYFQTISWQPSSSEVIEQLASQ
jgi:hypothetical protein